jgi:hypothetical protein
MTQRFFSDAICVLTLEPFTGPSQDLRFIDKIRIKSGMDTPSVARGNQVNPLEDLIIHLCIKDPLTCRNVIEAS